MEKEKKSFKERFIDFFKSIGHFFVRLFKSDENGNPPLLKMFFAKIGHFFVHLFKSDEQGNKPLLKQWFAKDSTQTLIASLLCALLGVFIGFIILICIKPSAAPEGFKSLIGNYLTFQNKKLRLRYFGQTLAKTAPLILTGLSVLFAYKAGLFNIGAAGQYVIGIAAAFYPAIAWGVAWYWCLLFGFIGGALWGSISGVLKAFLNVNEVISSIMLNWIGLYLVNTIMGNEKVWDSVKHETFSLKFKNSVASILPNIGLEKITGSKYAGIGIILAILIAIIIFIILSRTTFGYELKATGFNRNAAKYAGMKEKRNIILTMAIAGGLAGLAAPLYFLTDIEPWYNPSNIPSMGFDGISAAFLGGLNPIGTIFSAYFIVHITEAGSMLNTKYYSPEIARVVTSIIIYLCAFVLFFKDAMTKMLRERKNKSNPSPTNEKDKKLELQKEVK